MRARTNKHFIKHVELSDKEFMILLETDFDKHFKLNEMSSFTSFKLN